MEMFCVGSKYGSEQPIWNVATDAEKLGFYLILFEFIYS